MTIPFAYHPGLKRSLPIFSSITEHITHHHLGKLEHEPPGMTHQTPACLDESRLNACQRPALDGLRQCEPPQEVTQIISQDE